jgi:CPA2 family monovalent cation:H+ antiporter-2
MEIQLLNDIVIIFGLSVAILLLCHRLRIPALVGFLVTGALVGPYGMGLIRSPHEVEILAEVGVVLLLFTIGIEFSFKRLLEIRKAVLLGGSLQVVLTTAGVYAGAMALGLPVNEAIFFGFLFSLSSTAIVLRLLQKKGEIDSPHGRTSLGILVFQDLIIVPMMLLTPLLAGEAGNLDDFLLTFTLKAAGVILVVFAGAKWFVPWLLMQSMRTRSRELFLLTIVTLCLAVAWLTSSAGLSIALGAFIAGLVISESEYSHYALGNILPFRDVFTSFFFVSIGMLFDTALFIRQPVEIVLLAGAILTLKTATAAIVALVLRYPVRTSVITGLALCQVGEFSFILSKVGIDHGLLEGRYHLFLAVSVLTMAATPFIMGVAPRIAELASRIPFADRIGRESMEGEPAVKPDLERHLVIIGLGVNGSNVALTARVTGIPYVCIEMSPDLARAAKERGEPVFHGDASQENVLDHVRIEAARVVVVAINDPAAARQITSIVHNLNPGAFLIVRTRYVQEVKELRGLGASEVIPEEFETSVEIFSRVLSRYLVPQDEIEKLIAQVRTDGYSMFRNLSSEATPLMDLKQHFPDADLITVRLGESAPLAGRSLAESQLRKQHGVTVMAIRRGQSTITNPEANTVMQSDDTLYLVGAPDLLKKVRPLLNANEG